MKEKERKELSQTKMKKCGKTNRQTVKDRKLVESERGREQTESEKKGGEQE